MKSYMRLLIRKKIACLIREDLQNIETYIYYFEVLEDHFEEMLYPKPVKIKFH